MELLVAEQAGAQELETKASCGWFISQRRFGRSRSERPDEHSSTSEQRSLNVAVGAVLQAAPGSSRFKGKHWAAG